MKRPEPTDPKQFLFPMCKFCNMRDEYGNCDCILVDQFEEMMKEEEREEPTKPILC